MEEFANPVARLLLLLQHACADKQGTVRERWANVFGLELTDDRGVLRGLAELWTLVKEGKELVGRISVVNAQLYLAPLEEVEAFLQTSANLNDAWNNVRGRLRDGATLDKLAFCAETIEREKFELLIEKDELQRLLNSAEELLAEISNADVAVELKHLLIENLENLRRAIIEYRITGSKGIQKAIDLSIGSMMRHRDELVKSKAKPWAKKLWGYLFHADSVVSKSLKVLGLLGGLQKLLEGGE
jgi:hypothetical protein